MYPNFSYPVSDPALPATCGISPDKNCSSEIGTSHEQRQKGGVVEVTALVIPQGTWTFAATELDAFVHEIGNCIYSANVIQRGSGSEMLFGFKEGAGPMDPTAVAHFLRLQQFAVSSVTQS
jgi:hypothetical protein